MPTGGVSSANKFTGLHKKGKGFFATLKKLDEISANMGNCAVRRTISRPICFSDAGTLVAALVH
jgi:hypothetical protein